ncbi:MAG: dihydrodipicolinate synthase family protein [Pseudomonadota bacterium]
MTIEQQTFQGVFPVLPAIFDRHGAVDEGGLRKVLEYAIGAGADGIVFPGLASEYEQLTADERHALVALLGTWIGGRVHFVVGASAGSLDAIASFASHGAQHGASAAMIMTPHALADDLPRMATFLDDVARNSRLPIILQNAPKPMGIGLSVDALSALVRGAPGIELVKEETPPCGQRITTLLREHVPHLRGVFGGAGGRYIIDEMNRGAAGTMPACEIVEAHVQMLAAHRAGDVERARDLFEHCLPLLSMQAIFRWRLTKEVLLRRGLIESPYTRAPGPVLDADDLKELDALLLRLRDLIGGMK